MEGDGAGCLRCVTGCNGNFCTSSFLFALESWTAVNREVTLSSLLQWLEGGGTCLDQILYPALVSPFFEAVQLLSVPLELPVTINTTTTTVATSYEHQSWKTVSHLECKNLSLSDSPLFRCWSTMAFGFRASKIWTALLYVWSSGSSWRSSN